MQVPSIDCIVRRRRLAYLARLARNPPKPLTALLQSRQDGKPLPWIATVINDLHILKESTGSTLEEMPDPETAPEAWLELMVKYPSEWEAIVKAYYTPYNDVERIAKHNDPSPTANHLCSLCNKGFETEKALLQHKRRKHGVRNDIRAYIDG